MRISAIVAMTENRVIGKNNQLPWRLPADLRHFKQLTLNKPIVMGRKTYESIGRVLPGRKNIIITKNQRFQVPDALVVHSIDAAIHAAADAEEIMIIGGAELYREMLPTIQRIYMTIIHSQIDGESYFPEFNQNEWNQVACENHAADEENIYPYSFVTWDRR